MQPGAYQSAIGQPTKRLLTVHEAADALGLTVEAVRSRIKRGTLAKEKGEDGTVYVVLDHVIGADHARPDDDQAQPGGDQSTTQGLLIARLENEVEYLRREAEDWKQEARRKDAIIMTMAQRIPELEPAREASEAPVSALVGEGGSPTPPYQEKPSWWQRLLGVQSNS